MSEFFTEVVKLGPVVNHPNADSLDITEVFGGYPCIVRRRDFKEGDLAIYLSVDALVPLDNPKFKFMTGSGQRTIETKEYSLIRAKRLRGVFSMGLLVPIDAGMEEGQNIQELLGIKKYDPEQFSGKKGKGGSSQDMLASGLAEKDPGVVPCYDLEGFRKFSRHVEEGEEIICTEKINGMNFRAAYIDGKFFVGSRTRFLKKIDASNVDELITNNVNNFMAGKEDPDGTVRESFHKELRERVLSRKNAFWLAAELHDLEEKLKAYPDFAFFGELTGGVSHMRYGHDSQNPGLYFFDVLNLKTRTYLDFDEMKTIVESLGLKIAPIVYRGPCEKEKVKELTEGKTLLNDKHIREGIVIKVPKERYVEHFGRLILKYVSDSYHLL